MEFVGGKKPWGSSGKGDQVKETTPVINFLAQRLKGEVKTFMWKLNSLLGSRGLGLHRWCRATPELSKVLQHLSSSVTETLWGTISFQMWWLTLWEVLSFICEFCHFMGRDLTAGDKRRSGVKTMGLSVTKQQPCSSDFFFPLKL